MSVRLNKTIEGPAVGRRLSSLRPRKQEENQRPGFAFAEEDGDCHARTVQSNSTNNGAYFWFVFAKIFWIFRVVTFFLLSFRFLLLGFYFCCWSLLCVLLAAIFVMSVSLLLRLVLIAADTWSSNSKQPILLPGALILLFQKHAWTGLECLVPGTQVDYE